MSSFVNPLSTHPGNQSKACCKCFISSRGFFFVPDGIRVVSSTTGSFHSSDNVSVLRPIT